MSKSSAWHLEEQENPTWGNKTSYKNPVFQKRHYEYLADMLKKTLPHLVAMTDVQKSAEKFADKFAKDNPLFDKEKFLERVKNAKV